MHYSTANSIQFQGAMAVECRENDRATLDLVKGVNDDVTELTVRRFAVTVHPLNCYCVSVRV
jgi:porphobilinogen deaminase